MRNIFLIAWREFAENAKTKGFWLGIFLFPVIWILASQIPILLNKNATPTRYFVLADPSGEFEPVVMRAVAGVESRRLENAFREYAISHVRQGAALPNESAWLSSGTNASFDLAKSTASIAPLLNDKAPVFHPPRPAFVRVSLPPPLTVREPTDELERRLRNYIGSRSRYTPPEAADGQPISLFAAALIPRGYGVAGGLRSGRGPSLRYWCENQADNELQNLIEGSLTTELRHREYRRQGFDPAAVARIEGIQAPITELNPNKAAGEEKVGVSDTLRQWAPSAFVYLLWVAIFSISQMLLNSLIEEKSSRVVEVLLSSVTPSELMMGKLAGIATVGLVMLTAWIGTLVGIVAYMALSAAHAVTAGSAGPAGIAAEIPHDVATLLTGTWLLPAFAIYFILGYLLYAGLFLALGSTCNTIKDAQNYMAVIVLFLMVPLLSMAFIPRDPNGPVATFLSWIPPYTPFVMMNRIVAHPPWRDVIGTFILLVAFDGFVLWGCGKVFRIGVLRTGQPPGLIQVLGWLRLR